MFCQTKTITAHWTPSSFRKTTPALSKTHDRKGRDTSAPKQKQPTTKHSTVQKKKKERKKNTKTEREKKREQDRQRVKECIKVFLGMPLPCWYWAMSPWTSLSSSCLCGSSGQGSQRLALATKALCSASFPGWHVLISSGARMGRDAY